MRHEIAPGAPLAAPIALDTLLAERIDVRYKGFPPSAHGVRVADVGAQGWNVLAGEFLLPIMVLHEDALAYNLRVMADYCSHHGVSLAPHGKTTMSPQLVRRQLDAGAWGISAATVSQARVFRSFGVERIVLANQVVEPAALRWLAAELARNPAFEAFVLVDSPQAVTIANEAIGTTGGRPLQALVELGVPGGRTGCRSLAAALEVATEVAASPVLDLAGVEAFEGIISGDALDETLSRVDAFLDRLGSLVRTLAARGAFAQRDEVVVTAGGSVFFDRVVERLARLVVGCPLRVVLRSGCYVTHDSGAYERDSALAGRSTGGPRLRPAIEVWGTVLSRPEPDLALVGIGRRDVSFDAGLPVPLRVFAEGRLRTLSGGLEVFALNDQHAYVRVRSGERLDVGDLVGVGISYPCTVFDKWRLIPVVDDAYDVLDAVMTFF